MPGFGLCLLLQGFVHLLTPSTNLISSPAFADSPEITSHHKSIFRPLPLLREYFTALASPPPRHNFILNAYTLEKQGPYFIHFCAPRIDA